MKSVFDACCSIPPGSEPVRGTTTYGASSQTKPAVQTTTTATFTQGAPVQPVQQPQGAGQSISNLFSAVEGTAGNVKTFLANAVQDPSKPGAVTSAVSGSSDLLHSNVIAGEGEVSHLEHDDAIKD